MHLSSAASGNQILFAQIRKVDEENRLIYGRATSEALDRSGEICDYETSKPYFKAWSDEMKLLTNGASLGNVRAMHGNVAAGKITELILNDAEKAVDIVTKVVDDNEWKKVMEGVYTGFSIGGSYADKWEDPAVRKADGKPAKRYTAKPNEVSLVDRGCNPDALFFEVRKSDGSTGTINFQLDGDAESQTLSKGVEMKNRSDMEAELLAKGVTEEEMGKMDDAAIAAKHEELCKVDDSGEPSGESQDASFEVEGSDADVAEFAKCLNDNDMSMRDVIELIQKSASGSGDSVEPVAEVMLKGMYSVSAMARLLDMMSELLRSIKYEEEHEKDGSDIGMRLAASMKDIGSILVAMTAEEVGELTGEGKEAENGAVMALSDAASSLVKAADEKFGEALAKAGARNSKADLERIQKMHDHSAELGAKCNKANCADDGGAEKSDLGDMTKADQSAMTKVLEERDEMRKAMTEMSARLEKMESQLAPAKVRIFAVAKSDDTNALEPSASPEFKPVLKADGSVDEAATEIKKSLQSGGTRIR